jgi:hypothetical protein
VQVSAICSLHANRPHRKQLLRVDLSRLLGQIWHLPTEFCGLLGRGGGTSGPFRRTRARRLISTGSDGIVDRNSIKGQIRSHAQF